jgi:hypothetical protein
MHTYAQYGVIWTNYVMVVAITSSFGLKAMKLRTRYVFYVNTFYKYLQYSKFIIFTNN